MTGPDPTIANWLLAAAPVVVLMVAIFALNWNAPRAGAAAWVLALALALIVFGAARDHVAIASAKGLSLALFVLTIVWTSVYMFNLVDRLRGIDAIGRGMARLADDRLAQALLIGWGFSSFIQGVTGFGVPIAVAAPLLIMLGFSPARAASMALVGHGWAVTFGSMGSSYLHTRSSWSRASRATSSRRTGFGVPIAVAAPLLIMLGFSPARAASMALVGHGWAVTFGSMGSSYYTIQLVTGIEGNIIAPHMALLFAPVIVVSGALVAHIHGGFAAVRRSLLLVLITGSVMAAGMYVLAAAGAPQIAASVPAVLGMIVIAVLARTPLMRTEPAPAAPLPPSIAGDARPMPFRLAFMPYILLITLSVIAQIGPIKEAVTGLRFALDYPGFATGDGFVVLPAEAYAPIRLLNHPAPLIAFSLLVSVGVYALTGRWRRGVAWEALRLTYSQCLATSLGVAMMAMMAVIMADTGMTVLLARGIADASGPVFPLVSPFIGLLGAFMSGSNTNSNVMFGLLQLETARALDIAPVTISSIQSIGASVGSAMAPAKVLVGAAIVGLAGREREIFRTVTPYIGLLVLLAGVEAFIVIELLTGLSR